MEIPRTRIEEANENSLYKTLGITITDASNGQASSLLEPPIRVCWPFPGRPHGGVVFTQMDTTMAWAILSRLEPGCDCATVNLSIQYTAAAKGERFHCRAWVTHTTRNLAFLSAEVRGGNDMLVAMGQATFRIIKGG